MFILVSVIVYCRFQKYVCLQNIKNEACSIFIIWFMVTLHDSSFSDIFIGGIIAAKIQYQFAPVP